MTRPTRSETYFALARVFALRGTCERAHVGAVIVKDDHVIAHGYNGAPRGLPHCQHTPNDGGCGWAVHAEENAICYAARVGVNCDGADLYCTHEPCLTCSRMIIQSGITRVHFITPYRDHSGAEMMRTAGVEVIRHDA